MSKFKIGDKVRKVTGYPFNGVVCATYDNEEKCVVKHNDKWEHIFSDKQLVLDHPEYQYLDLLKDVLENGDIREGRNGKTYSTFGKQMVFDLKDGFPLFTTKKVHWKSIVVELLWFLRGDTNIKYLKDSGVSIWDEWADENGNLGPVYGSQWRYWTDPRKASVVEYEGLPQVVFGTIDQIRDVIDGIKKDPYGRRHIVSAWNPSDVPEMALPPCHALFQFHVNNDNELSCQLYQRSADLFLGVPFNVASYALLTHLVARETGLKVGKFIHTMGDAHIYDNHVEQIDTQVNRTPFPLPYITIESSKDIFSLEYEDIKLHHYNSHPAIKGEVSK